MNIAVNPLSLRDDCEVAIVGAGPYGLAVAAHLRAANVSFRIFGDALSFWRNNMPTGMLLRSPWIATHIAEPGGRHTLDDYYAEANLEIPKLLPVERFVDYGRWFQRHVAPDLDTRSVINIENVPDGFRLTLADGDTLNARRVVMATGLLGHEYRPAEFDGLPRELVFHTCEHTDSERYRGKRVAVVGSGQSACEAAALLHEAGAEVELICRDSLAWNADPGQRSSLRKTVRALLGNALIPPSQVGPFPYSWLNEVPGIVHRLPLATREKVNEISLRATAILWLRPRLKDVPIDQRRTIKAAARVGDQVALTLDNGTRRFDHVVLGTGYRYNVAGIDMLDGVLRERIARRDGLPVLSNGMQSSVPGLHFVGSAAVGSYGPLLRFIAGAGFAARCFTRVARHGARAPQTVGSPALAVSAERV